MHSFRTLDRQLGLVPAPLIQLIGAIDTARGREEAFRGQNPPTLKTLTEIARIQSTEASNAIENIHAPIKRIEALVREKTTPANRPEQEIAGYGNVLDQVHASARHIPFKISVIEQFHRDLYELTAVPGGRFKLGDNTVKEFHPDGREVVRFKPVGVGETRGAMEELHQRFDEAWRAEEHHRLLLIGAYVFDFLMIHPFQDGNGRLSRLLTLLLLYQAGYEVGRFISLEKMIEDTKETYYDSLQRSTTGWHDDEHVLHPWLNYLLGTIVAAYKRFESHATVVSGRGSKTAAVLSYLRSSVSDVFTFDDIRHAAPAVSDSQIRNVLNRLKKQGAVEPLARGPGARWRRLHTDF